MANILAWLKTWSVLIVLVVGIAFNFGVVMGWWATDNAVWSSIDTILLFTGLGSVRAKLEDLFAGIDLGSIGMWITGKKTYLLALLTVIFDTGQLFGAWTVASPVWMFINQLAGVLGIGTFMSALNTYKKEALRRTGSNVATGSLFKKAVLPVVLLMLIAGNAAEAQTWENFWHPRPPIAKTMQSAQGLAVVVGSSILEFKPTGELAVTQYRPGINGATGVATFLDAFGPALTMQHSTQDAYGVNYADWSVNLSALLTGNTSNAPVFTPEIALTFGCLNNLLQAGAGYDLTARSDNFSRWSIHVLLGINVTSN